MTTLRKLLRRLRWKSYSLPIVGWHLSSERLLKRRLIRHGARIPPPRRPAGTRMNAALKTQVEVERACAEVRACGLPPHIDRPKNWDAIGTLEHVLDKTDAGAAVLEIGATVYSAMLPWLYLYGYRRLQGIDLVFTSSIRRGPISYEYGDITRTRFDDGSFDAIICLSVIEHGVDLDKYFAEASRLLRPSGVLVTSTDYWETAIDTRGKEAYGVPVRVFNRDDIPRLLDIAASHGLELTGELDLDCDEKVVYWQRMDLHYTFLSFALRKQ